MEVRVALAACVVLGSTLCGKAAADALRRRVNTLDALAEGLRTLRIHMTSLFEPVRLALERADCPLMTLVAAEMDDGRCADEAWRAVRPRAARRGGPADALTPQDMQALDTLFSRLGQSGRDEQEALLNTAAEAVGRLRDSARKKAADGDRLYVSLGLLVGLMLALIVI